MLNFFNTSANTSAICIHVSAAPSHQKRLISTCRSTCRMNMFFPDTPARRVIRIIRIIRSYGLRHLPGVDASVRACCMVFAWFLHDMWNGSPQPRLMARPMSTGSPKTGSPNIGGTNVTKIPVLPWGEDCSTLFFCEWLRGPSCPAEPRLPGIGARAKVGILLTEVGIPTSLYTEVGFPTSL